MPVRGPKRLIQPNLKRRSAAYEQGKTKRIQTGAAASDAAVGYDHVMGSWQHLGVETAMAFLDNGTLTAFAWGEITPPEGTYIVGGWNDAGVEKIMSWDNGGVPTAFAWKE